MQKTKKITLAVRVEKPKKQAKVKEAKKMMPSGEKSAEAALYYGFSYINAPVITRDDLHKTKNLLEIELTKKDEEKKDTLGIHPEEKVALLRTYLEQNMHTWPQPVMLYYEGAILPEGMRKKGGEKIFHMDILGTTKSIAEAMLIKVAYEILKEEGYTNLIVNINSIGDKESMARFCRELANYYRKNIEALSPHCRQAFKKDPYDVFECKNDKCQTLKDSAPNPISYLTEASRQHFKEVLEYLETLDIPYRIHNSLICSRKLWSQTAFEIVENETNSLLATGVRYNQIAKKIGFRKELGSIGISVSYKKPKDEKKAVPKPIKAPKVYFIQLGFEAKLKSLQVIEMLRQAKIPMTQSLGRDKLLGQIQSAENSKIPYTIIMGQKEAMDNTVIVREMITRSQEIVPLANLQAYLKKIK